MDRERINENQRMRRRVNPEKDREWYRLDRLKNPEKYARMAAARREQYKQNPEPHKERQRQYHLQNSEKCNLRAKQWKEQNPDRVREYARQYYRENPERYEEYRGRVRENPVWQINNSMRSGIYQSIKSGKNGYHWESLVGYTCDELMTHLATQFTKGMTWDNYGEWHIDHIKPISHFNFESYNDPEFKECWSSWNLQPLWAFDNWSKNNRVSEVPLPLIHKVDSQP